MVDKYVMELNSEIALDRHTAVAHGGNISQTCFVCIQMVVNGMIIVPDGQNTTGRMVSGERERRANENAALDTRPRCVTGCGSVLTVSDAGNRCRQCVLQNRRYKGVI